MQRNICILLFFVATTSIHGLKLLVDENLLDDDDETWEADIRFSYKPFPGKCTKTGGTPDVMNYPGPNGEWGNNPCAAEDNHGRKVTQKDVDKYCTKVQGAANQNYKAVYDALVTKGFSIPKLTHYLAKLASMVTDSETIAGSGTAHQIKSFELLVGSTPVAKMFKEEATGGTGSDNPGYYCYSQKGIAWAKNDPKVQNIYGEEFDILATGTFTMLHVKAASKSLLNLEAQIDRAGSQCGATYIQDITMKGAWVEELEVNHIQVRAKAAVLKHKALEINVNKTWMPAPKLARSSDLTNGLAFAIPYASRQKLEIELHDLKFVISVDAHRIQEAQTKTSRYANFLNMQLDGMQNLHGLNVEGILGTDNHDSVTQLPEDCDKNFHFTQEEKPFSLSHVRIQ